MSDSGKSTYAPDPKPIKAQGQEMIGLHQPVEIAGEGTTASELDADQSPETATASSATPANKVIGVICSGDVAVYRDQVKTALERGLEQRPDAVWVCVEPKSDHMTHDVMLSLDIAPVVLPLCPRWKRTRRVRASWHEVWSGPDPDAWPTVSTEVVYDIRRTWRDAEMMLCDELIVFRKRTGSSPWRERKKWSDGNAGVHRNLFVVELGPEPVKRRASP